MTGQQLRLLGEAAGGKWHYRCASRGRADLEAFQAVADGLLRLEALGYLRKRDALVETGTGRRHVDRVYVRGGIMDLGSEELLPPKSCRGA